MTQYSCALHTPLIANWVSIVAMQIGHAFLVSIPLGALLYSTPPKSPSRQVPSILVAVVVPYQLPNLISSIWPEELSWMDLFIISCVGFMTFFKSVAVAFENYPSGADRDLKTFLCWYISILEPITAKGKPKRLVLHDVVHRTGLMVLKVVAISVLLSFFRSLGQNPSDYFEVSRSSYAMIVNGFVHMWYIYLFLAFSTDFASLFYSILFGTSLEPGFRNPLLASRSFQECWAQRWNMSVQLLLKRNVYIPARKIGLGRETSALLTFLASGLLHEYTFSIHNATSYRAGEATLFFAMMGIIISIEGLLLNASSKRVEQLVGRIPSPVISTTTVLLVAAGPFEPLFVRSWLESGFINATSGMFPFFLCKIHEEAPKPLG
eukprot:scaffold4903_cov125-Cylindrotheca_fusiformis.AAC.8